ncbi:GNAT family N-acetyltransferase [Conexibacter woesei]|uniref:GCN5-related N-acetyltransferase n=1 Tax=Conexibacter woesei (strain DSM 14684 / CCUG 47730 / CIP 108061 / JCM 11494 / NBRC 100937 / ID131577) TaxID=469383 RepID=D3F0L0_CONWI|nr:GNAT family N-acetyltransferase [Conexibacter woesei]ADB53944.1 GCN5-related N-acetyltransferase [Conexibacter woesei DSM 14684]
MSDGPHVWRADVHDADVVAQLLIAFRDHIGRDWPSDNAFHAGVDRLLEIRDCDFLLAAPSAGEPAVAVCQLRYSFSVWRAGTECVLEDLYVTPDARRGGYGATLVQAALARARERDCRWIELDTHEDNAPAIALYERHGFRIGRGPGARDIVLAQPLD